MIGFLHFLFTSSVFLFTSLLALFEVIFYPGIINRYFGIPLPIFVFFTCCLLFFLGLFVKLPYFKQQSTLILSKFCFIILLTNAIVLFATTVIETLTHTNYIFSTFHFNHHALLYNIWLLATYIFFIQARNLFQDSKEIKKWGIFFSILVVSTVIQVFFRPLDIYAFLSDEDGFYEWMQFGAYAFSGLIFLISAIKAKGGGYLRGMFFFIGFLFFLIAFEEISWFQRVTNHEIALLQESNLKNETNIHNNSIIQSFLYPAYVAVGVYAILSDRIRLLFFSRLSWMKYFTPPVSFFLFFLPLVLVYTSALGLDGYRIYQEESAELLLSLGCLFFAGYVHASLIEKVADTGLGPVTSRM